MVESKRQPLAGQEPGAAREGEKFFGDPTVYIERYLPDPRHVELQVLADSQGNVIHLGERDCSLQRSHQKLLEETPSPALNSGQRAKIGKIATDAIRKLGYKSDYRVFIDNAPDTYRPSLDPLPDDVHFLAKLDGDLDLIHLFTASARDPLPETETVSG